MHCLFAVAKVTSRDWDDGNPVPAILRKSAGLFALLKGKLKFLAGEDHQIILAELALAGAEFQLAVFDCAIAPGRCGH